MPKVFICYRREDSAYPAQQIYGDLAKHFGSESVVFDIETIPLGTDFREYLNSEVSKCDILLAVIGDQWTKILKQRLNDPNDFVRIEIQAALEREIPVVPVLVGNASVPIEKNLPPELATLAYKNATEMRAGPDLQNQLKRLTEGLNRLLAERKAEEEQKRQEAEIKIKTKKPELVEVKPLEPKLERTAISESDSLKPLKSSRLLKISAVAGVIVMLITGIWYYFSGPQKKIVTIKTGRIFVESVPENATVRFLSIDQPFKQGMELEPGKYHLEVFLEGYETQKRSIIISPGEEKRINLKLSKIKAQVSVKGIKLREKRFALVIGNGSYKNSPLRNPTNDAHDMALVLKTLGFEVTHLENAEYRAMERAIRNFGNQLRNGGVGLFYFAGHGIQGNGRNYLIPVDAEIETESDVNFEAVDVGRVFGKMEDAGNDLNIVILDACRDNPFSRSFRASNKGLAPMDAPKGSLIAYATAPGAIAADGEDRNGIFTKYLLKYLITPGLTVEQVLKKVRIEVFKETDNRQIPWESSSLTGVFSFNPVNSEVIPFPPPVNSEVKPSIIEP